MKLWQCDDTYLSNILISRRTFKQKRWHRVLWLFIVVQLIIDQNFCCFCVAIWWNVVDIMNNMIVKKRVIHSFKTITLCVLLKRMVTRYICITSVTNNSPDVKTSWNLVCKKVYSCTIREICMSLSFLCYWEDVCPC